MAKLERITNKIFGESATATGDNPEIGQFGSAAAGTYVGTTDIETLQALPAYSNGWIDAVTPDNQFPALPEMTGVHKILSYQTGYIMQEGVPEYDANTTYYTNSFCKVNGNIYISLEDDNINNNPSEANSTHWKKYDSRFLNKQQITNCILEAPNGVFTRNGNNITVKQGLKVLIPDGLNSDGTLKNIEYTVPYDVTKTLSTTTSDGYIVVSSRESSDIWYPYWEHAVFMQEDEPENLTTVFPQSSVLWYQPSKNVWWYAPVNSVAPYNWTKRNVVIIGRYFRNNTTTIQSHTTYDPVSLLKTSDKIQMGGWSMPSNIKIELTLGASGTDYVAPANGWFTLQIYASAVGNAAALTTYSSIDSKATSGFRSYASVVGQYPLVCLPVLKGQKVRATYIKSTDYYYFAFTYAQGEV